MDTANKLVSWILPSVIVDFLVRNRKWAMLVADTPNHTGSLQYPQRKFAVN
jgi:hypothetical protein